METTMFDPRAVRDAKRASLLDLAATGDLSLSTVHNFEKGRLTGATGKTRRKLATAYGVEVEQIDAYIGSCSNPSPQAT